MQFAAWGFFFACIQGRIAHKKARLVSGFLWQFFA
jgi:hypothetical protein